MKHGSHKAVKTNSKTEKTTTGADSLYSYGDAGNTYGTRLPDHGTPRGAKKVGKRRTAY